MRLHAVADFGSFLLNQAFFLVCLSSILGTSTFLGDNEGPSAYRRNFFNAEDFKTKYYINKKGTQVIEIGHEKDCHVYDGADAEWLHQLKRDRMVELNFFQFRLMVGKCRLEAFLKPLEAEWMWSNRSQDREGTVDAYPQSNQRFGSANLTEYNQDTEEEEEEFFLNTTPSTAQAPLVYPGTLWCGRGSVAKRAADLGHYTETDKCCREHDQCTESMESKTCKYGICNYSDYTRSHCDCDERFRFCLQQDRSFSSFASFKIANLYFNILKPMCYAHRPPVKYCRKHRITGECIEFEYENTYPATWQFFPAQPYPTVLDAVEKFMSGGTTTVESSARRSEPPPTSYEKVESEIRRLDPVEASFEEFKRSTGSTSSSRPILFRNDDGVARPQPAVQSDARALVGLGTSARLLPKYPNDALVGRSEMSQRDFQQQRLRYQSNALISRPETDQNGFQQPQSTYQTNALVIRPEKAQNSFEQHQQPSYRNDGLVIPLGMVTSNFQQQKRTFQNDVLASTETNVKDIQQLQPGDKKHIAGPYRVEDTYSTRDTELATTQKSQLEINGKQEGGKVRFPEDAK